MVFAEEAVLIVGLTVEAGFGEELLHKLDFAQVFRNVGLHGNAVLCLKLPQLLQQLARARGNEAGRDDGQGVFVLAQAVLEPFFGLCGGFCGAGFADDVRRGGIHVYLAHVAYEAAGLHLVHQQLCGLAVAAGEDGCAGGGALQQAVGKDTIGLVCVRQIGVFGLLGEGVHLQPLHQLQIHAEAAIGILGRMDVQIHQAGEDQLVTEIFHGQMCVFFRQAAVYAAADTVDAQRIAALHCLDVFF